MSTLHLKSIKCIKKQDSISKDEPYIVLDNSRTVHCGSGFKKDVLVNLEHEAPYKFNRRLAMQLWEKDKNSKDDDLGKKLIDAKPTSGVVTAHFNKRAGADYTISYVVR